MQTFVSNRPSHCRPQGLHRAQPKGLIIRAQASSEEVATFALGCFWHPQHAFKKLDGVIMTKVGYTGGKTPEPTYESVCDGDGHTEAVRAWFDPSLISYEQLLEKFFEEHDPTKWATTQYKSAIWCHNLQQAEAAKAMISQLEAKYGLKILTTVAQEQPWTDAEEYHQDYMSKLVASRWGY